jgi:hypothetical protein
MANPDLDIATAIGAGVASLTLGVNLFAGAVRPYAEFSAATGVPVEAVFCLQTGGRPDTVFKRTPLRHLSYPSVQVTVRSSTSFQAGQDLSEEIFTLLNHNPVAGYVEWSAVSSAPFYLGKGNDEQHHEWTINIDTIIDEVVT